MKTIEQTGVREGYERWAEVYDGERNPLLAMDDAVMPRLLGDVRGKRVLELGCGTGRHTVRLADAGATVNGVDFSPAMLRKAQERVGARAVTLAEHDVSRPLPFEDARFDLVLACLVLEHVESLAPVFREVHRVLRAGGALVVSDMHPAMRLRGVQANFDDPRSTPEARLEVQVKGHLHLVSEYVTAALATGFTLAAIEEHAPDDALAAEFPRAAKFVGWPMLLALRVVRS